MDKPEIKFELDIANIQLTEIQSAIATGNYSALQYLLLNQAVSLHKIGIEFVEYSKTLDRMVSKKTCIDVALRAFGQSQRTMATIKFMKADKEA
jgi:hypothetical protein